MTGSTFPFYLVSVFYCHFYQNLMNLKVLANQRCSIRKAEKLPLYSLISQWNASISSDESSYLSSSQVYTLVFFRCFPYSFLQHNKACPRSLSRLEEKIHIGHFSCGFTGINLVFTRMVSTTRNKNHQTKLITLLSTSLSTLTK